MLTLKTKITICFWVLSLLFISSCAKDIPTLPFLSEETKIKKILQEQGKSVVFIGMYSKKGDPLSYGSGFFVSQDGMVATNYHVVAKGYGAIIKTLDGRTYEDVYLLSYDQEKDIALLKVKETNAPFVKVGNSDLVKQGDKAFTIGNPEGLQNTVSDGIISGIREYEGIKLFQITCPISHGSSGGPLYNLKGEVIGITTLMSKIGQNLNFAVPINYIRPLQQEQKKVSLKEKYLEAQKKLFADYLEKQTKNEILDPNDALFKEAYELYKKAMGTSKYPDYFTSSGTKAPEGIKSLEQAIEVNPYYHAAHYVLGTSYRKIKEYGKAEKCFLKCIDLKPEHQDSYMLLASLYKAMENYDGALEYYNKSLNIGPPNAWIYFYLGDIYLKKNNLDKAEEFYKKTLKFKQIDSFAYQSLALIFLRKGDLKSSWNCLKKSDLFDFFVTDENLSKQIAPYEKYIASNNFYAYASVGRIYYGAAKYGKAIEYLEKANELSPSEFDQYYELGMAHNDKGNRQKAIQYLEQAVAINPNHYDANLQLGILYDIAPGAVEFSQKQYKIKPNYNRAIELFKRAKEIIPKSANPYYYLGRTYYHLKQYYDAINETKKALNIEEDSYTLSQLGDIYFAMNEYENALVAYKKSLTKNDFQYTRCDITNALFELKKYDEAIVFLNENLEKHKDDIQLKNFLADAYRHKKDYNTAITKYKEFLESDPEDFSALFGIADCHYDQENWAEAKIWWEKAIEINPKSSAAFYNIGLASYNMKAYSLAQNYFKKALGINPDDNKYREWIINCQLAIEHKNFPEKLRKLSRKEGDVGILATLMLCTSEYIKANNLWIQGVNETKYEDGENIVSPKIFEAQGYFEKTEADLKRIVSAKGIIQDILNSFSFAVEQRVKGIEQYSRGFYKKRAEYEGEYEKGRAKMKLADAYFVDSLKMLCDEVIKHKSHFGNIAEQRLNSYIEYYEKKE